MFSRASLLSRLSGIMLALFSSTVTAHLPPALAPHYQLVPSRQHKLPATAWSRVDNPGFIYYVCLRDPSRPRPDVMVMCGVGDDKHRAGGNSGYFDIWYLKGDNVIVSASVKSGGRYGASGEASPLYIGKHSAVRLEERYNWQGVQQLLYRYYLPIKNELVEVASLPVFSNNEALCEDSQSECLIDNLRTDVTFNGRSSASYPEMNIHTTGILAGKKIDKRWVVNFDSTTHRYTVPKEIHLSY